ncbi:MAG: FtsX-like permease family protein, partial [Armatimonadota bacterium]
LAFRPVRQMALEASQGTSDFSQLFLGLSMFLVLSGAGLGGMLLRLLAQRRSQQAGIMQAVGYPAPLVGRALVIEGLTITVIATVLGVPAGMGYAAGIIRALNNWWSGALGRTGALWFHWTPASLIIGAISGLAIGTVVVVWSARQLGQSRALELLRGAGRTQTAPTAGSQKLATWSLGVLLAVAAALALLSTAWQTIPPQIAFFGIGFALLLAALSASKLALSGALQSTGANRSILRLSLRNAAANSGRSLLVIGLIAAATFTIVAVAANSQDLSALDVTEKDSGTGGFELQATCSVPLPYDPQTEAGRRRLGFSAADEKVMQECEIVSFRRSPGEDISCLNIARPQHPLVLGVPQKMIQRGGFSPTTTSDSAEGWKALQADTPGVIPAFGDAASVRWTLHSGLGEYYSMPGPGGQELPFRFVGLLANSIFQSELLVDEAIFEAIYPSITAPAYFLIDTPPGRQEEVARILRRNLGEMGFQVRTTTAVLNDYLQVQNTYLSMFLALGGLGLLLGTVGLVTVLLRSALERRSELALMLATGFNRAGIAWTLVVENGGLLVVGLVMGTVSALIAVAPQLASATSEVNWWVLSGVLSAILAVGMISCGAAAYAVVRGPLIPALREE